MSEPPTRPSPASQHRSPDDRSSRRAMRLVRLLLMIAEHNDVGLSQEELLDQTHLAAWYNSNPSALYQAFSDDVRELAGQSLSQMRAQHIPPPEALIRLDPTTKHFHLAHPLHVLPLSGPAAAAFQAMLVVLQDGAALPGGKELCERLLALVPPDQRQALMAPSSLHMDVRLAILTAHSKHVAEILLRAHDGRRTIEFEYLRPLGSIPTRHAGDEVIGIFIGQHPYVTVWCPHAQHELDLRLERFVAGSLRLLPNTVNPRVRQGVAVRYILAPRLAESATTIHLEDQHALYQEDGSVIVSGSARSIFWARRLLLGYGEHAHALAPPQLIAEIQQTIAAMAAVYAGDVPGG